MQAAGSWSIDACCAVAGNDCQSGLGERWCTDRSSSSDWLFGLWPGPPQRFEPTGNNTAYQSVSAGHWPQWGDYPPDLALSCSQLGKGEGLGGLCGVCHQGGTYRGKDRQICGGDNMMGIWGTTSVEVWVPRY
eukprot:COSAG02_NODE_201_length_29473_cov_135.510213_10_plen_133_part_00